MRKESSRTRTLTYRSWESMKQRCDNPKASGYEWYGAIGVSYDPKWQSYDCFLADMGHRTDKSLTIDRIDHALDYSKENCRWATKQTQAYNRGKRKNSTSKFINVHFDKNSQKWVARRLLANGERLYLGLFDTEGAAQVAVQEVEIGV